MLRDVAAGAHRAEGAAWAYPDPTTDFRAIAGYLAFYAGPMDACFVGDEPVEPPFLCLLASGGHTLLLDVPAHGELQLLGGTLDDAAGEAFDKGARLLGLPYPGGPHVQRAAEGGDPRAVAFPRGLTAAHDLRRHPYGFSFSGLKTAVARHVEATRRAGGEVAVAYVAASFQESVADVLSRKAVAAAREHGVGTVLLGGGVAANARVRGLLAERCAAAGLALRVADVDAARAELEGKGVVFDGDTIATGVCRQAWFKDPDGNALMLHRRFDV